MARRSSLLAPALPEKAAQDAQPSSSPSVASARSSRRRVGKYHLGAYFDPEDPTAEAFRVLAARIRRSHQDLLSEAIADLVAKYEANQQFGR